MCGIGKKMNQRRLDLGLTLEEVGNAVGVSKSTVKRWENGNIRNMGRDKIAALAKALEMNPVEFVPSAEPAISAPDQERLEALHQNPRLGLLFDRSRKMTDKDIDFMLQMADRILGERDGE